MKSVSDTESLEAEPMAQSAAAPSSEGAERRSSAAAMAQGAPSEDEEEEEEEPPTPAPPVKRGRPKGSKDAQPRTRTKPVHTPSKQYTHDTEHHSPPNSAAAPLRYFEEAMEHARQQEMTRRQTLYTSWLPY